MMRHGFLRVAAGVPRVRVADCAYNSERIIGLMKKAQEEGALVLVLPELSLTGYTCGDLFHQLALQRAAVKALEDLVQKSLQIFSGLTMVGLPLVVDDKLYNCAAVFQQGRVLGVVPKSFLPNYQEFYEARWFAPGSNARNQVLNLLGQEVPFGTDLLFDGTGHFPSLVIGVEICEDLWLPITPSAGQALAGATLLINLSASNEVIGKAGYRRQLVINQSGRCLAAYLYASCGVHESTTDLIFGGHCILAENGALLAESPRFQRDETMLCADVDIERLSNERQKINSFVTTRESTHRRISSSIEIPPGQDPPAKLLRTVEAHPFVPSGQHQLAERCQEIFQTQVAGLAKRLEHIGKPDLAIGVSGGLDSTLALLVACKTLDLLSWPRTQLNAMTLPGFGTSERTLQNARAMMRLLGVTVHTIEIRSLCLEEMRALNYKPFGIDLTGMNLEQLSLRLRDLPHAANQDLVFENVQARMRTSLLMNKGFVIGTGDLSELALGWSTYNGDHMSMYNPNCGIPKTLVKFLVGWAAKNEFENEAQRTLFDILGTEISPELLPRTADGKVTQATESVIGPYELHDFFLFHFLRYGAPPEKILYLATQAKFDLAYKPEELRKWLKVFLKRFFANQFKRSCLPDGPKVGSISLSPRGDWRMPSDAQARVWLDS